MKTTNRFTIAVRSLMIGLLLVAAFPRPARAQLPELRGMGLSGSATQLDTIVVNGDSLHVIATFTDAPPWVVGGVALSLDSLLRVAVHAYSTIAPQGIPLQSIVLGMDPSTLAIDTLSDPNVLSFRMQLSGITSPLARSIQLDFGLYSRSPDSIAVSARRSSHAAIDTMILPLLNPVDGRHFTYLRLDRETLPPVITFPDSGMTVGRRFVVRYDQPEGGLRGSLVLSFTNTDTTADERPHILYLRDPNAGIGKEVRLDALNLVDTLYVDSLERGSSATLNHMAAYSIVLGYRDIYGNPTSADSVRPITVDVRTDAFDFIEPRAGSFTADSNFRLIYHLREAADTLWLIFEMDSLSTVIDPQSPHFLRLSERFLAPGLNAHLLPGGNLGTSNPDIIENPNGESDRLISQCIYNVTLTAGDALDNEPVSAVNYGFVWPDDRTTLPPRLIAPDSGAVDNESFWIEFRLPEPPLRGSVRLRFQQLPSGTDPGSPHDVYLNIAASGIVGFNLIGTRLSESDVVDSVRGSGNPAQNNTLVHNATYVVRVIYRDVYGNPEATSSFRNRNIRFDNATEAPTVIFPTEGSQLAVSGTEVRFDQPERALPGSLQLLLTQIGGPVADTASPHILFISSLEAGFSKSLTIRPGFLETSVGIDSVRSGGSLVARGVYQLAVQYRDTLGNPYAAGSVYNLTYPSGTSIMARGRPLGSGYVEPGVQRSPQFFLALKTNGGESILRALRFFVEGDLFPSDLVLAECRLWSSVDTTFSPEQDTRVDNLDRWDGAELVFDTLGTFLNDQETYLFVSFAFATTADPTHTVDLLLMSPSAIDCGGDPVNADFWPIGNPDIALPVELLSMTTAQEPEFGALRLIWVVASEFENAGFTVLRKGETDSTFRIVGSWRNSPGLQGRGTDPTMGHYRFTDTGLTPGRSYRYRLRCESYSLQVTDLPLEAEGTPRIPPSSFVLGNIYPNPFNQRAKIPYVIPTTAQVKIRIYDLLGRQVATLVDELQRPSSYTAVWDGMDSGGHIMPSGVYLCRMEAGGDFDRTVKLLLIR